MSQVYQANGRLFTIVGGVAVELQPVTVAPTTLPTPQSTVQNDKPYWHDYDNVPIQMANGTVMTHDIYSGKVRAFHPTPTPLEKDRMDNDELKSKDIVFTDSHPLSKRSAKVAGVTKDGTKIAFRYGRRKSWRPANLCRIDK